ncbi:MAG: glycosyltransferase WbuB, partial [Syntrophales bacterium LBB04]|nr:glycosyltransferase WbuB [Syntrophales bacterium LBB04]
MHLLLLHQAFASLDDPGGTRHFELARYMVKEGHNFTIVAGDTNYTTGKRVGERLQRTPDAKSEGVRILRTYSLPGLHKNFFWRVMTFLSFMLTSVW